MIVFFKKKINPNKNFEIFSNNESLNIKKGQYNFFLKLPKQKINKMIANTFFRNMEKTLLFTQINFVARLILIGVGFRVELLENKLVRFKLGFSHFFFLKIPKHIELVISKKTLITLKSCDEQNLKQFCVKICNFRPIDSYKGKGLMFKDQVVFLKEIKKSKK